jgi:hypothetical protein
MTAKVISFNPPTNANNPGHKVPTPSKNLGHIVWVDYELAIDMEVDGGIVARTTECEIIPFRRPA